MLSTIAFCLPGTSLPEQDWFAFVQLDKWIHIGLFSVMVTLWCLPLLNRYPSKAPAVKMILLISLTCLSYGVAMEFVQHYFISNRSFDVGDIFADAIGCVVGIIFSKQQWKA